MKTMRLLFVGLASLTATLALVAGTKESKKTYTVVGYYAGVSQPSAVLVEKAAKAVGEKMAGFTQVQDPNEAEHTVEIKFRRNSFEIYVDALPLERRPHSAVEKQSLFAFYQQGDLARDAAEGRGINN
jgi:hypothetical protein